MSAERTVLDHVPGPNGADAADCRLHGRFLVKVATGLALLAALALGPVLSAPRFASADKPPSGVAQQRRAHDFRGATFEPKYLRYCGPTPANFLKLEAEGLRLRYTGANVPPTNNPCGVEWRFHVRGNFVATAQYEIFKCEPPSRGTFLAGGELYMKLDNPTSDAIAVSRGVYPDGSAAVDFKLLTSGGPGKRIVRDFKRLHTTDKSLRGRLRLARDGPIATASFAEGEAGPFTAFQRSEIGNADIRLVRFAGIAGGDAHAVLDLRILELQLEGEALALDGPFSTPVPRRDIPKTKPENPKAVKAASEANRLKGTTASALPAEAPATESDRPREQSFTIVIVILAGIAAVVALLLAYAVRKIRRQRGITPTDSGARSAFIPLHCAGCGKNLNAANQYAGKQVKCPGCGRLVPVPAVPPTLRSMEPG
jgi:hypothetical protein